MNTRLYRQVKKLVGQKDADTLTQLLSEEDFHDTAQIINMSGKKKTWLFSLLSPQMQSTVILALTDNAKKEIIPALEPKELSQLLRFVDNDDATDLMQYVPKEKHHDILETLQEEKRSKIEQLLQFDPETAGGFMDLDFIIVKDTFTFQDIAAKLQSHVDKEDTVPHIVLTTEEGKIRGYIPHKKMILSAPDATATQLSQPLPVIKHNVKPRTLLRFARDVRGPVLGVIDDKEHLLGIIHISDILRIAQSEATNDIFRFAGIKRDETPNDSVFTKVHKRYLWLIINLGTAFLAASVVGLFENTIAQLALLAVFMPVVAGEGGNAATQALAVVVRGLAVDDIPWSQARKIILRESLAGAVNGIIVGFLACGVAILFRAPPLLGVVLGTAMVVNLFIAGLFGALIPFILKSLKIDPAVASSIFVTTATDIIGFFVFLGLGTILLL